MSQYNIMHIAVTDGADVLLEGWVIELLRQRETARGATVHLRATRGKQARAGSYDTQP